MVNKMDAGWLYPQYDFVDASNQSDESVYRKLKVSTHIIDCSLNAMAYLICSTNKGDDYEFFLVLEKYFITKDGNKFKVLKIK